ncbi:hypothetical protein BDK51DRAFT_28919 [Blyttiomyces helicus]|uniref:Transmembrane protein 198 n=1 Tax=Blyttiomyces helicus TaxID=388810 RepID=A0A4P9WMP0_9FUNG|nr:hypothetical protein BDK51DRAFT_28919 [Blyttiomyces helicus]|eukprot:RKO93293.1 hypothetical protein BDK51DRAFT_28919 [Blyttiomyces helicus]
MVKTFAAAAVLAFALVGSSFAQPPNPIFPPQGFPQGPPGPQGPPPFPGAGPSGPGGFPPPLAAPLVPLTLDRSAARGGFPPGLGGPGPIGGPGAGGPVGFPPGLGGPSGPGDLTNGTDPFNSTFTNGTAGFDPSLVNATAPIDPSLFNGTVPIDPSLFNGTAPINPSLFNGTAPIDPSLLNGTAPIDPSLLNGTIPVPSPAAAVAPPTGPTTNATVPPSQATDPTVPVGNGTDPTLADPSLLNNGTVPPSQVTDPTIPVGNGTDPAAAGAAGPIPDGNATDISAFLQAVASQHPNEFPPGTLESLLGLLNSSAPLPPLAGPPTPPLGSGPAPVDPTLNGAIPGGPAPAGAVAGLVAQNAGSAAPSAPPATPSDFESFLRSVSDKNPDIFNASALANFLGGSIPAPDPSLNATAHTGPAAAVAPLTPQSAGPNPGPDAPPATPADFESFLRGVAEKNPNIFSATSLESFLSGLSDSAPVSDNPTPFELNSTLPLNGSLAAPVALPPVDLNATSPINGSSIQTFANNGRIQKPASVTGTTIHEQSSAFKELVSQKLSIGDELNSTLGNSSSSFTNDLTLGNDLGNINFYSTASGIVFIITGIFMTFFGYKLLKPLYFIIGFWVGAVLAYVVLTAIENHGTDFGSKHDLIYAITIAVVGLLTGALFLCLWQIALYATGALLGFVLALAILSLVTGGAIHSGVGRWIFIGALTVLGGVVVLFLEKPIMIIGTATVGAFAVVFGIDVFARQGYYILVRSLVGGEGFYSTNKWVYVELGGFALLAIIGICVQYATARKSKRAKYTTVDNERGPAMGAVKR